MFNIVMFGPPGSGKGTQSEIIQNNYKLIHLSTGDVLRAEVKSGSDLGKEIAARIDKGNYVSDEMIQQMVKGFVLKNKEAKGFIFDGFPRTIEQAKWLENVFAEIGEKLSLFLLLDVNEEELKQRILKRGKDSGREDDQDIAIIENRIEVYKSKTKPVIDYYKDQNKATEIQGVGSVEEVYGRIKNVISI